MCKVLKQFTEGRGRNYLHPPPPPPTVKLRQKSGKIPVKILIFSGKICVIKQLFV
jgi:hypothetical protein